MKPRHNHEGVINILMIKLKRKTEFSYCSLTLLPARKGHEDLYLWRTNLSLAKYFKAHSTECALLTLVRNRKSKDFIKNNAAGWLPPEL